MQGMMRHTLIAVLLQAALILPAHADTKSDQQHMLNTGTAAEKANKKLVYDFWRNVLEGGHLDLADKYLTPSYIQHNPNVATGRDGFVAFFTPYAKPHEVAPVIQQPLIDMVAEGDKVVLSFKQELPDPANPGKTYVTTWFDMFRIQNNMIAEHWDSALKDAPKTPAAVSKEAMHLDGAARKELAGNYAVKKEGFPPDFAIAITEKDDHLMLDVTGTGVGSSGAEAIVGKLGDDKYQLVSGDVVQFARSSDGKVFKATVSANGQTFAGVKAAQ